MIHIPCTDYHLFSGNVEQQLRVRCHSVFRKRVGRRHHICEKQNNQNYSHVKNITCGRRVYSILSATVFYTFSTNFVSFFYIFINLFCLYIFFSVRNTLSRLQASMSFFRGIIVIRLVFLLYIL